MDVVVVDIRAGHRVPGFCGSEKRANGTGYAMTNPSQLKIHGHRASTQAARRGQSRRSKNRAMLLSLGIVAGTAALAGFSPWLLWNRSSVTVTGAVPDSFPTGTIAENDTPVCRRLTFDDKGQVVRDVVPCDGSVRDARGQPVPIGTIQRLDAISKSFAGR
jgi:hypothetical protein